MTCPPGATLAFDLVALALDPGYPSSSVRPGGKCDLGQVTHNLRRR